MQFVKTEDGNFPTALMTVYGKVQALLFMMRLSTSVLMTVRKMCVHVSVL